LLTHAIIGVTNHLARRYILEQNESPEEVGDAAVFLASDLARGVTGNVLFVDAGMQVMGI